MSKLFGKTYLKPCPFCGGEAKIKNHEVYIDPQGLRIIYEAQIVCSGCGASTALFRSTEREYAEAKAFRSWDRRTK